MRNEDERELLIKIYREALKRYLWEEDSPGMKSAHTVMQNWHKENVLKIRLLKKLLRRHTKVH